jgi:integrase
MTPVLWTYYKSKDGLFPVKIRTTITTNGKTKVTYSDTGIRIEKKQFANGRVKGHPKAQEYNFKIAGLCNKSEGKSFMEYFRDFADRPHGYYHKKKLNNVIRIIEGKQPAITLDFMHRLERDLVEDGKHPNYIADIFVRIRTVVNLMVKAGDLDYHKNPFLNFKLKRVKTEKKRLSFDQLLLLQGVKLDKLRSLARDMYILSFYQGGIRFGDLCRLNKNSVQGGRLHYTMHKTSQERNLPLNPISAKILKRYKYKFLDIDPENESRSISAKNALMNKYLKAACKIAKIPEVSFHTSRHSIADYAVKKKLTSKQLQGILGHGKLSTTEAYLKAFYREETDAGMDQLFS